MLIRLTGAEITLAEDRLHVPELHESLCLRLGTALGQDAAFELSTREIWTIIHAVSVFDCVGSDPAGGTLKAKLYRALSEEAASDTTNNYPVREEHTYADRDPNENPGEVTGDDANRAPV